MPAELYRELPPTLLFSDLGIGTQVGSGNRDEQVVIGKPQSRRSSFTYHRLPEPLLRLSVLKLDGSSFDVQIVRTATVSELKMAIEAVFVLSCDDSGHTISWHHVWGHFCLSYKGQRLTDDKASIRSFGIKDGDEVHFVHHLSINYNPCKRYSRTNEATFHRKSMTSMDEFEYFMEDQDDKSKVHELKHSSSFREQDLYVYDKEEDHYMFEENGHGDHQDLKKGHLFLGWFSYSRLKSGSKTKAEAKTQCCKSSKEQRSSRSKLGKWLYSRKSKA